MLLKKHLPAFFLILVSGLFACTQKKTLDPAQTQTILKLNTACGNWGSIDSNTLYARIDSVEKVATQQRNKAYFLDAELVRAFYFVMQYRRSNVPKTIALLERIKKEATDHEINYIAARVEERYGHMYNQLNNDQQIFDHWQKQIAISYKLKDPDEGGIFGLATTLYHLGDIYYYYGEYRNSITYLHLLMPRLKVGHDAFYWRQGYNTLGLNYQKLGMLDSSDYYLKKCYDWAIANHNIDWQGIANDGLGTNLYLRGKYNQAIPLLRQNADLATKRKDWWSACGSLLVLADIDLKINNLARASSRVKLARQYIADAHLPLRADKLPMLYPVLAKLYAAEGNGKRSQLYIDSTAIIKDSINRKTRDVHLLRMQQRMEIMQQNDQMKNAMAEASAKKLERNLLIALITAVISLSVSIYLQQHRKHRQDRQLKEIRLKQQEDELASAKEQLQELLQSMSEKNRLIAAFDKHVNQNDRETFDELRKTSILTEHDWDRFKFLFEKVHPAYFDALNKKMPGISKAEVRFMALAKLKLNNKEMAAMLAVSPESLRVTWHRLRKKMQLPNNTSVDDLVESIR
ncbi:MAG: hypothetical protein ACXVJD_07525 [Mucilaginibacter sp.]